jgi:Dockerin type I domain/Cadherin domain/Metallo-peptidase family M12B Reprolysin-like
VTNVHYSRQQKRLRLVERLCERSLFASDLLLTPMAIPLEPDELVQWDREHYSKNSGSQAAEVPLADTFRMHSRPTATKTIYLDFDGAITIGTSWNRAYNAPTIVSPAYDPAGNGAAFTNAELTRIQGIWQRVATDFAPFDVNVTTQDPGEAALVNTGGSDTAWGMRVIMTVDNFASSGAGGFAFINSFVWNYEASGATDTPCYVFNTTEVSVAAAITHEIGHTLGLDHDGTNSSHPSQPNAAYYNGHGSGENSWGPIMGVGGYYSNVTTWDAGEYFGANNVGAGANFGRGPDDISIITNFNGFGVIPDDHGATANTSTQINYLSANASNPNLVDVSAFGTIQTRNDLDFIRIETGGGAINLTIDPYISETFVANPNGTFDRTIENAFYGTSWANNQGANLDVEAKLYDAFGTLIATSNPTGLRANFANVTLTAGTYFISIDGASFGTPSTSPPLGYTDYGSLGQYLITGTVVSLGIDLDLGSGTASYSENSAPVLISPNATFRDSFGVNFDLLTMTATIINNGESTDRMSLVSAGTGVGQISTSGNQVRYSGTSIGTFTLLPNRVTVDLSANANRESVEALIRSIGYSSVSDGPSTLARKIEVAFGLGVAKTRDVNVLPANDSPSLANASLPVLDEDTPTPGGAAISAFVGGVVSDPDPGAQLAGIAIVGNLADPINEGTWYYSSDQGGSWTPVGLVNDTTASLLVSASNWIGFRPVANYFGNPGTLRVRALDNTFVGAFSNSVGDQRTFLSAATRAITDGPVSINAGNLLVSIRNINDAPLANASLVQVAATQDVPLVYSFDNSFPGGLFTDIDSVKLTWSLVPIGFSQIPNWLSFDPVAHTLKGVPANADVGAIEFQLRAADNFASVSIPLRLSVANVNDAPQILGLVGTRVTENEVGAKIGQIASFDPDLKDSLTYSVSDDRFVFNDGVLYLRPSDFLDFEAEARLDLMITATDNGLPSLATTQRFTITVDDANEYFPTFGTQDLFIPFNRVNNQLLGTVQAIDLDSQQIVKYSIQQDAAGIFQIDADSGQVRLKSGAQVTERSYRLFIGAADNGEPSNSRVVLFNVTVEVPNQFAPTLVSGRNLSVTENAAAQSHVGRVVGTDADGDTDLRYSTASRLFNINPITGMVTVAAGTQLNYETQPTYVFSVDITDSVIPKRTSSHPVTITLQDANDPPSAIRLLDAQVPTLQKGIALSQFVVTDEDPPTQFTFATNDPRFEIRNARLALRNSAFFASSAVGTQAIVNISLTDMNNPSSTTVLPLSLNIVNNPFPWQNRKSSLDVNTDGFISAVDALLVINALNSPSIGRGPLNTPREFAQLSLQYIDTSGDNELSPLDALLVLNRLNSNASSEGEAVTSAPASDATQPATSAEAWFDAFTSLENERRRRS